MIDFIIKLEDILNAGGHYGLEIRYIPEYKGYLLKLDGDAILMTKVDDEEFEKT